MLEFTTTSLLGVPRSRKINNAKLNHTSKTPPPPNYGYSSQCVRVNPRASQINQLKGRVEVPNCVTDSVSGHIIVSVATKALVHHVLNSFSWWFPRRGQRYLIIKTRNCFMQETDGLHGLSVHTIFGARSVRAFLST